MFFWDTVYTSLYLLSLSSYVVANACWVAYFVCALLQHVPLIAKTAVQKKVNVMGATRASRGMKTPTRALVCILYKLLRSLLSTLMSIVWLRYCSFWWYENGWLLAICNNRVVNIAVSVLLPIILVILSTYFLEIFYTNTFVVRCTS